MSTLEQLRQALEDVDQLELGVVDALSMRSRTHRDRINKEHRIARYLTEAQSLSSSILENLKDKDGTRAEELSAMTGSDAFPSFYSRLRGIREYHSKFNQTPDEVKTDTIADRVKPEIVFSGEEGYGRYLDLIRLHDRFINLPGSSRIDYTMYLNTFNNVHTIEIGCKTNAAYKQYLGDLVRYLADFHRRSQPLVALEPLLLEEREHFLTQWGEAKVLGWADHTRDGAGRSLARASDAAAAVDPASVDLDGAESAAALETYGLDTLKAALTARGLKCGGSLKDRAARLFSVKGLEPSAYPKKIRAKGAAASKGSSAGGSAAGSGAGSGTGAGAGGAASAAVGGVSVEGGSGSFAAGIPGTEGMVGTRLIAWLETCLRALHDMLDDVVEQTKVRVVKKQTLTYAEIEAEQAAEAAAAEGDDGEGEDESSSDDEEDDQPIYNPKNLPLGWDGKPIPYWLYKLHGLNQEFKCEICGDVSYWGRRSFERHFNESAHASGMRRLRIPNTKHFSGVVGIQDALDLYAKLKDKIEAETFKPEEEEEFEDSEGNVLSRKTYEDLARQGLL